MAILHRNNQVVSLIVSVDHSRYRFPVSKERSGTNLNRRFRFIAAVTLMLVWAIASEGWAAPKTVARQRPKRTQVVVKRRVAKPHVIKALPPTRVRAVVKDKDCFCHAGVWYGQGADGFRIIVAPRGARAKVIPTGHTAVAIGGITYYHYYGTYDHSDEPTAKFYMADPPEEAQTTDIVYLVDDDVLKGTYLGGDEEKIQFQVGEQVHEIDLTDVVSVSFEPR